MAVTIQELFDEGRSLHRAGKLAEAAAVLQRCLEMAPRADAACTELGHVLRDMGKLPDAVALYQRALSIQPGNAGANGSATFDLIHSTMIGHGYTRYWDSVAQVPWLYNSDTHTFVSYEDEQSVAAKCRYVIAHKLAGVMFWDLESDSGGKLLHIMDESLR